MAQRNIVEAINSALTDEMQADQRVMVLGLDVGKLGGVFRTTSGLIEKFGSERVVDTPLAEASIVGASLGLALAGMVPVAEIQFLGFTAQAFHQIGPQLGKYRQRSRGRYHCQVTIRAPFGGGIRSPEFHSDAVEAQFVQSPGIKIVMPSNPYDAKGLLIEAIRDPDPVLSADALAADGISAAVLDLRTLVPLDVETLCTQVAKTGRCVVVHEAPLSAGFGAEVSATLMEEIFYDLDAPVMRVGAFDVPFPAASLEDHYLPSLDRVVKAVKRTLES